jgi:hypothetical protein
MKICAIGDIHGRIIWKEIVEQENNVDKWIFIGDYFDTHYDVTVKQQIENFKEILEFKKSNLDKVVLLLGNHCFHYLKDAQEHYSGYQAFKFIDINEILEPAVKKGLVIACYTYENYVFTHAGVTKTWCEANGIDTNNLAESINNLLLTNPSAFRFTMGDNYSNSGNDVDQSPIWVRIPSLMKDAISNKVYIVGHTTLERLAITDKLIGIDTLGTTGEYLIIEDGIPSAKKSGDHVSDKPKWNIKPKNKDNE